MSFFRFVFDSFSFFRLLRHQFVPVCCGTLLRSVLAEAKTRGRASSGADEPTPGSSKGRAIDVADADEVDIVSRESLCHARQRDK